MKNVINLFHKDEIGKTLEYSVVESGKYNVLVSNKSDNKLEIKNDGLYVSPPDIGKVFFSIRLGNGDGGNRLGSYASSFSTLDFKGAAPSTNEGGGVWDSSSNTYTIPETGVYDTKSSIRLTDYTESGVELYQVVNTSNSDVPFGVWTVKNDGRRFVQEHAQTIKFNKGDKIRLVIYCSSASDVSGASLQLVKLF